MAASKRVFKTNEEIMQFLDDLDSEYEDDSSSDSSNDDDEDDVSVGSEETFETVGNLESSEMLPVISSTPTSGTTQQTSSLANDSKSDSSSNDSDIAESQPQNKESTPINQRRGVRTRGGTARHRGRGRVRTRGGACSVDSASNTNSTATPWNEDGCTTNRRFRFSSTAGVKKVPDMPESPLSNFKMFFTDELINHIVSATNKYAEILISSSLVQAKIANTQRSLFQRWKPVTVDEIWVYIAVLLLMSVVKKPQYYLYWTKNHFFSTPMFPRIMRRDRFQQIRKMIHFSDPDLEDQNDTLRKLRFIIDHLLIQFNSNYTPKENVAIDEYLSLWKGRLSFKIYIPSKRECYGIKLFMLCESDTGYLSNFIIYTGATTNYVEPNVNLPQDFDVYKSPSKVVLSLMADYLNKGYCLTLDKYYMSPEIVKTLFHLQTDCYGTLRKKQNLPNDFWNWKPVKGAEPMKIFDEDIMVLRWNDVTKTKSVKIVNMLSTIHTGKLVDSGKKNRLTDQNVMKPDVIVDYNKTMGGVDLLSRVLIPYSSQRRGVKWYRKIAELLIDISIYNSFIVFRELNQHLAVDHLKFRMQLVEEILQSHLCGVVAYQDGHEEPNIMRLVERHFISPVPSTESKSRAQRRCIRCSKRDKCGVGLCVNQCFEIYHTQHDFRRDFEISDDEDLE